MFLGFSCDLKGALLGAIPIPLKTGLNLDGGGPELVVSGALLTAATFVFGACCTCRFVAGTGGRELKDNGANLAAVFSLLCSARSATSCQLLAVAATGTPTELVDLVCGCPFFLPNPKLFRKFAISDTHNVFCCFYCFLYFSEIFPRATEIRCRDSSKGFAILCPKPATISVGSDCGSAQNKRCPLRRSIKPISMRRFRW